MYKHPRVEREEEEENLVLLIGFEGIQVEKGEENGAKGLSSCFILLGTSLIYANSGTTNMDGLYVITSISENVSTWYKPFYINFSLLIFSIGFLFKVSAAPFHFWAPDVYDAIPTIVTTFVAIIAKISIFILLLDIVYYTNNYFSDFNWTYGLLVSSLLSLIIGTVVGLAQSRIKRLLAYSTISHIGFLLLALAINSEQSIESFIFYIIQYSVTNLNTFLIILALGYLNFFNKFNSNKKGFRYGIYSDSKNIENMDLRYITELTGQFMVNPILSLSLAVCLFSMAGIVWMPLT